MPVTNGIDVLGGAPSFSSGVGPTFSEAGARAAITNSFATGSFAVGGNAGGDIPLEKIALFGGLAILALIAWGKYK